MIAPNRRRLLAADDAGRHCLVETERAADGEDPVTHLDSIGIAQAPRPGSRGRSRRTTATSVRLSRPMSSAGISCPSDSVTLISRFIHYMVVRHNVAGAVQMMPDPVPEMGGGSPGPEESGTSPKSKKRRKNGALENGLPRGRGLRCASGGRPARTSIRTTLGATAFAVAANALERRLATRGCARADGCGPGLRHRESRRRTNNVRRLGRSRSTSYPFPSQDPRKLENPTIPMIADLRTSCPGSSCLLPALLLLRPNNHHVRIDKPMLSGFRRFNAHSREETVRRSHLIPLSGARDEF